MINASIARVYMTTIYKKPVYRWSMLESYRNTIKNINVTEDMIEERKQIDIADNIVSD